jgi:hypothetical protein
MVRDKDFEDDFMKRPSLPLLGCLMLILAGCGVRPTIQGRQDPYPASQVMYADEDLQRSTAVGIPVATRDEGGILHVQVPIRSTTDRQLFIDYRYLFLDRNGQVIWKSAWRDKVLAPNVPDTINFNSTTAEAADFQLDLRYAQ